MKKFYEVAVFVNGPCNLCREEVLDYFLEYPEIYCADGGANYVYKLGFKPSIIFGDMDSIEPGVLEELKKKSQVVSYPVKKDRSDLEIIIDFLIENFPPGKTFVRVFGGFGGRPDHQLGHLQLLEKAHSAGLKVSLVDKNIEVYFVSGEQEIKGQKGDIVSIFAVTSFLEGLYLSGFEYETNGIKLTRGTTLGLSNTMLGQKARISIKKGKAIVFKIRTGK